MQRLIATLLLFCSLILSASGQGKKYAIRKIVIDPGHGGHDAGCGGRKSVEKDVALGISLKLGKLIEDNLRDVKVIYTRKSDVFVELHERADIANNNKADLFICIHCNSACSIDKRTRKETCNREVKGTEIYVLGLHKTDDNLRVAQRENASILMEENYQAKYEGFDPSSPEAYIIFSLYQNAFIDNSINLASKIESQFRDKEGRTDRGVKQAGFLVLWRTTMPSILIETGFLTSPAEEDYLNSEEGQDKIAASIYNAFVNYKNDLEDSAIPLKEDKKDIPAAPDTAEKNTAPSMPSLPGEQADTLKTQSVSDSVAASLRDTSAKDAVTGKPAPKEKTRTQPKSNIIFRVQLTSSSAEKPLSLKSKMFSGIKGIVTEKSADGKAQYYMSGKFSSAEDAEKFRQEMRKKGFRNASTEAYNNGKRISLSQARQILKNKVN